MLIKVFSVFSKLSSMGVLEEEGGGWGGVGGGGGGGGQQATCLVAKQAVEFPQVLTSYRYVCAFT